jgi:uroporphyrinogen-III synthase
MHPSSVDIPPMAGKALAGVGVVITRPAATARPLARQVLALGGSPVLVPGLSLRGVADAEAARGALVQALGDELVVFTSPAAVRFAARLMPLATRATVVAVGQGTAMALRRLGIVVEAPARRQDSEGLLELEALAAIEGRHVALIGAAGGRGLLRDELTARGAHLREVHVYRRVPPRLDRRHVEALLDLPGRAVVLLSSAEALANLHRSLPAPVWERLRRTVAVVSSERLRDIALAAGFADVAVAASAMPGDLLDAATARFFTRD